MLHNITPTKTKYVAAKAEYVRPGQYRVRLSMGQREGKRVRRTFYGRSPEEATAKAETFITCHLGAVETFESAGSFAALPHAVRQIYWRCGRNARARAIPFDLSEDDYLRMLRASKGRCSLSGVPFSSEKFAKGVKQSRRPFMPSIDRRDSGQGYTPENCRLVCVLTNFALNDWGEEALKIWLTHLVSK